MRLLMLLGGAVLGGLLSVPQASARSTATLRFFMAFEAGDVAGWQPVIAEYERHHPEIAIKLDAIGGSGAAVYPDVLRTSLASGDPPDIFTKWGGEVAGPLIDAGQVEEVSRYFGKYGWQQELASWAI